MKSNTPQYGFDAPGVIAGLLGTGAACLAFARLLPQIRVGKVALPIRPTLALVGAGASFFGTLMTIYGVRGKYRMRERMLGMVEWRGDEQVLDIGTGRGFLLNGAAKHLTAGHAIGIDIWRQEDLSGNTLENALQNARLEGVADKIEIKNEDARKMSFPDASFDVVLSLLCIHNIEDKAEQAAACREIARVLKPGGKALIADYLPTGNYARAFAETGLTVESNQTYFADALALMWMVVAYKPS